jgi:site-specific recombinase XerD
MNIQKLKETHPKLLEYLNRHGYSKKYVGLVNKYLRILFDSEEEFQNYEEFYARYVSESGLSSGVPCYKFNRIVVRAIRGFDEDGHYPDRVIFAPALNRISSYGKLNPCFRAVVDDYQKYAATTDKRPSTISGEANSGSAFLFAMQKLGCKCLSDITGENVLTIFYDGQKQTRGYSCVKNIQAVFKTVATFAGDRDCSRLCKALPPIRKIRKNFPYLTTDEECSIKNAQAGTENKRITLRDKAIVSLVLYTGMRGSDIAKMTLSDIDWKRDRIVLTQSKTEAPLILPLRAVAGNAIMEYIKAERPNDSESKIIFNNVHCPGKDVEIRSMAATVARFFDKANVRPNGKERGIRIFRHHMASKLLENEVPLRVISDIPAHAQ